METEKQTKAYLWDTKNPKIILTSRVTKTFFSYNMAKVLGLDAPENQYYIYLNCKLILELKGMKQLLTPEQIKDYEIKMREWNWAYSYCLNLRETIKKIKDADKQMQKKVDYLDSKLKKVSYRLDTVNNDLIEVFVKLLELTDLKHVQIRDIDVMKARMGWQKMGNNPEMDNRGQGY